MLDFVQQTTNFTQNLFRMWYMYRLALWSSWRIYSLQTTRFCHSDINPLKVSNLTLKADTKRIYTISNGVITRTSAAVDGRCSGRGDVELMRLTFTNLGGVPGLIKTIVEEELSPHFMYCSASLRESKHLNSCPLYLCTWNPLLPHIEYKNVHHRQILLLGSLSSYPNRTNQNRCKFEVKFAIECNLRKRDLAPEWLTEDWNWGLEWEREWPGVCSQSRWCKSRACGLSSQRRIWVASLRRPSTSLSTLSALRLHSCGFLREDSIQVIAVCFGWYDSKIETKPNKIVWRWAGYLTGIITVVINK